MNIDLCKAEIKRHEGEVLEIYNDSLGYKTLGVGHLCQPQDVEYSWKIGTPVSQDVVDVYYEKDFYNHITKLIDLIESPKTPEYSDDCSACQFTEINSNL